MTREAEELLFALADRMTEGDLCRSGDDESWFGTTMFTVPLVELERELRGTLELDALVSVVQGSVRVRLRAMRLACADVAHRHPDRAFGRAEVETQARVVDGNLQIDVDLRWPLEDRGTKRVAR